tara:strand:- start:45 stop:389 length:345 start_codon:yes stop_codon:yes gene_type:complete
MATKPKEATRIDHLGVTSMIVLLRGLRKGKKAIEEQEKECSDSVKDLMEEFGPGRYIVLLEEGTEAGEYTFSYSESTRNSLDKDMLLDAGVDPAILERCTKETVYRFIGPINQR